MRLEMIGHASMFVHTANLRILMDPVLWDPHQEGLFDIYPGRRVLHDRLPKIDVLILSHRHLDHFDIRSLRGLSKDVRVFIPCDSLLESYLRKLGFERITPLKDFSEVRFGETRLLTTRSENNVPEYGIVFSDPSGTIWNQVDSVVTAQTVATVRERFPKIDLLVACWQPMLETAYQTHKATAFPYERYSAILYNIGLVEPTAVTPGANAFRYKDGAAWLNGLVFPVARERFLYDLGAIGQHGLQGLALDPGDAVVVVGGTVTRDDAGCQFVVKDRVEGVSLAFRPVTVDASMVDDNPDGLPEQELEDLAVRTIEEALPRFIEAHSRQFGPHQRWKVIYQVEVIMPHAHRTWSFDFTRWPVMVQERSDPRANVYAYVTASALHAFTNGTRGWDYAELGGYYRCHSKLYVVTSHGIVRADRSEVVDPLLSLYPYDELCRRVLDRELQRWAPEEIAHV